MPRRFTTTAAHMEAFSQQQRERFEDEMVVHLRREYPAALAQRNDAWVRDLIREGTEQAREYGIILERDVARYVELMLALSPDFDDSRKTPWCKEILNDDSLTAERKLDRIYEFIIFKDQEDGAKQGLQRQVPRPFHGEAVRVADRTFWARYPELDGRRPTMEPQHEEYRGPWMTHYHQALDDLGVPPATCRPHAEVGAPIEEPPTLPSGDLVITLVDGESRDPIAGASIQVSGPTIERAVSGAAGEARFESIAIGEYEIFAMDLRHRSGQGRVVVKRGETRVSVSCRRARNPHGT